MISSTWGCRKSNNRHVIPQKAYEFSKAKMITIASNSYGKHDTIKRVYWVYFLDLCNYKHHWKKTAWISMIWCRCNHEDLIEPSSKGHSLFVICCVTCEWITWYEQNLILSHLLHFITLFHSQFMSYNQNQFPFNRTVNRKGNAENMSWPHLQLILHTYLWTDKSFLLSMRFA